MVSTYARRALLVVVPFSLCAQVPIDTTRSDPEREFETALEETTQDAEDSQLVDLLTALLEHPLDINTATIDELTQIPGITPIIAFHIVTARDSTLFTSPDQLLRVEGITDELFERIRDFVCVIQPEHRSPTVPFSSLTVRVRTVRDLQQRQGFLDGSFQGSAWKVYSRLTARSHRFGSQGSFVDVGLLTEKDAGENSFSNFLAGYLSVYLRDYSSSLLVGDFTVEAAEGLVFWRSIGFSKGSEVISTVKKGGVGIRPYLSTDENWYFRGVAGQVDLPGVSLSAFYSSKPLHASVNSEGVLTSFYSSGLFRTESELLRRSTAHSTLIGGRATGSLARGLKVGGSLYQATFSPEVMQSSDFGFKGRRASMFGMDISFTRPTFSIFTEGARSSSKSVAAIGGVIVEPVNNFEIALTGRYYPKEFKSLYGNGFGETHSTQNETGIYTAARVRLSRWLTVSSYFDQYSFPWKSGTVRTPSHGNDFLLFSDVRLSDRLSLELRYRHHNKPDGEPSVDQFGRSIELVGQRRQTNYRVTFEYRSSIAFRTRSRVEVVNVGYQYSPTIERGLLVYQDVQMYPLPSLRVDVRVMVFETDSFDSRLYEFEGDVRGTFSNPALFGKGIRWYLLARYELDARIDLWVKYAQTIKDGVRVIGSGSNQILGDLENRLSFQVDILL